MNSLESGRIEYREDGKNIPFSSALTLSAPMTLQDAKAKHAMIRQFCFEVLTEGVDYGIIPGTEKKVLHKPGAEKLCQLLNVHPKFISINVIEDFSKPFFFYRYECQLIHNLTQTVVGTGIGSCNSMETKYRWRLAKRKCPSCGQEAIIQGKPEYGGGWLCFRKQGGCGAKFKEEHPDIIGQEVGRIENAEIFDQVNTLDKMAQKRALLAPVLVLAGVSEYFTQDLDDLGPEDPGAVSGTGPASMEPQKRPEPPLAASAPTPQSSVASEPAAPQEVGQKPAAGNVFEATAYRISLVKKIKHLQSFKFKRESLDEIITRVFGESMLFIDMNRLEDISALQKAISKADELAGSR